MANDSLFNLSFKPPHFEAELGVLNPCSAVNRDADSAAVCYINKVSKKESNPDYLMVCYRDVLPVCRSAAPAQIALRNMLPYYRAGPTHKSPRVLSHVGSLRRANPP